MDSLLNVICQRQCTVLFSSHAIEDVERIADRVGLIFNGKLQLDVPVKDLLSTTRRIRAVLKDACIPKTIPEGTIWQQIDGRELQLTVTNFTPDTIPRLQAANSVENIEVEEISLPQFFKDYVKGRRAKNDSEMNMLLWKDYRLSRTILIAGVFFLAGPYLLLMVFHRDWDWHYENSWIFSVCVSQFIMSLLAGNIIASERIDRSTEFLAFQGASRKVSSQVNLSFALWCLP